MSEQRKAYVDANQLSGFRSDIFNDEFGDVTQRFEAQVQQRNFEHRLQKARQARLDSFVGEMDTTLSNLDDMIDAGTFNAEDATSVVNSLIKSAMDQGNDRKEVLNAAVGFLEGKALEIARRGGYYDGVLEVMEGINLKGSTYGLAYKDRIERLRNQLITDSEQAARQDYDDDTLARATRARELSDLLLDGLVENKYDPKWFNSEETRALRDELFKLDPTKSGNVDSYFRTQGEVTQGGDMNIFNTIAANIDKGINEEQAIETAFDNGDITYNMKVQLQNANRGRFSDFVQKNGLQGMSSSVGSAVKQSTGFASLLSDATRNDLASQAQAEMFARINDVIPLVEGGKLDIDKAKARLFEEQTKIIEKYRKMAEQRAIQDSGVNPASEEEVKKWQSGDSPWKATEGTWNMSVDEAAAMWDAANRVLRDPSQQSRFLITTELGQLIAPLEAAGENRDAILRRFINELIEEQNRLKTESENATGTDAEGRTRRKATPEDEITLDDIGMDGGA